VLPLAGSDGEAEIRRTASEENDAGYEHNVFALNK